VNLSPSRLSVGWLLIIAWGCGDSRRASTDAMSPAADAVSDGLDMRAGLDASSAGDHSTGDDADGMPSSLDARVSPADGDVASGDATSGEDGPGPNDGGGVDGDGDAGGPVVSCRDTCAFKDSIGCGGGATCVDRCESDPGRMRCPQESDALSACILTVGAVALTCVNGLPTLKPDYCPAQQRAAMACLQRDAG